MTSNAVQSGVGTFGASVRTSRLRQSCKAEGLTRVRIYAHSYPILLNHDSTPFDDPEWVFEIKHDGYRALALIEGGHCGFVSRNQKFGGLQELAAALVVEVNAEMAVLDGELAVPDETGRTDFRH